MEIMDITIFAGKQDITLRHPYSKPCIKLFQKRISTGSNCIDTILEGGLSPEAIILIYGEAETGKTTLAMQCAVNAALQNTKTLFIDCDNTFATERLADITQLKFNQVAEQIILMKPKNFAEQSTLIDNLQDYINTFGVGLVVIDTFNGLYRAQVAEFAVKSKAQFNLSRELNRQLAVIAQISKTQRIPFVITSQVKALINEPYVNVAPVATRVLQFWANITIALKPTENPQMIQATIRKNHNPKEVTCDLRIAQTGIHDYE